MSYPEDRCYELQREKLFSKVKNVNKHFENYNKCNILIWLMINEDNGHLCDLAKFIYDCFEHRKSKIKPQTTDPLINPRHVRLTIYCIYLNQSTFVLHLYSPNCTTHKLGH